MGIIGNRGLRAAVPKMSQPGSQTGIWRLISLASCRLARRQALSQQRSLLQAGQILVLHSYGQGGVRVFGKFAIP
jgi:hypothetical protein